MASLEESTKREKQEQEAELGRFPSFCVLSPLPLFVSLRIRPSTPTSFRVVWGGCVEVIFRGCFVCDSFEYRI